MWMGVHQRHITLKHTFRAAYLADVQTSLATSSL